MSNLILLFNGPATEKLGANTRMRVKTMKRAGQVFVALRPSYRVSGKNAMIQTDKNADGSCTAELLGSITIDQALPEIKSNPTTYLMDNVGYGWFLMKERNDLNMLVDAVITVSKALELKADCPTTDTDEAMVELPVAPSNLPVEEGPVVDASVEEYTEANTIDPTE